MVLGSSRALNEALQHATTELMRWLMESYVWLAFTNTFSPCFFRTS